ncbi:hypothetical protein [Granulicella sp. L60]|uniref:hypothetical protein n=1 Tax=Granulicella sp. L60 TaxID=1641866 RepID=UPI001C204A4E|nr:hypothetical protein [Granulicella sp. L60]
MKAAMVSGANQTPVYGDFREPVVEAGQELITVRASALTHATRGWRRDRTIALRVRFL